MHHLQWLQTPDAKVEPDTKENPDDGRLINRITICPARYGHEKVSSTTADTVKEIVKGLPANMAKILDEGGATGCDMQTDLSALKSKLLFSIL